jgi:hypothetical protein
MPPASGGRLCSDQASAPAKGAMRGWREISSRGPLHPGGTAAGRLTSPLRSWAGGRGPIFTARAEPANDAGLKAIGEVAAATRIWLCDRLDFQGQARHGLFYTKHYNEKTIVLLELATLFPLLTNTQYCNLFGFSKKQRRYICHECCHDARIEDSGVSPQDIRTATLVEGTDAIFCHLCQKDYPVRRIACVITSCKSNVISDDKDYPNVCHLCGYEQNDT